jgi:hypothetical protein
MVFASYAAATMDSDGLSQHTYVKRVATIAITGSSGSSGTVTTIPE